MFGTWISQIQSELRTHFPASRDYRSDDFRQAPMPASVAHFLEHALRRRAAVTSIEVDETWFDTTDPALADAEEQWRKALTGAGRYPASVWDRSIDQAVGYIVSFLVNPADSFCDFVFGNGEEEVHPRTILHRAAYFQPYSALRGVITGYAERKGTEPVSREDLRAAILKADRSIVANMTPEEWVEVLKPLYDLAAVLKEGHDEPAVPTSVLKPVFEAKAADELVLRIEAIESIGGRRALSQSALLTALGPTEVAAPEPEVGEEGTSEAAPEPERPRQLNDIHAPAQTNAIPRWMQFTTAVKAETNGSSGDGGPSLGADWTGGHESAAPLPQEIPSASTQPAPATATTTVPKPDQIGRRAALPDDVRPSEEVRGLEPEARELEQRVLGEINPVQRAWFVNHLFRGSQVDFQRVVGMLDGASDWESASGVIASEVFERNNIDIYSQPAVEFTNVVEARYL